MGSLIHQRILGLQATEYTDIFFFKIQPKIFSLASKYEYFCILFLFKKKKKKKNGKLRKKTSGHHDCHKKGLISINNAIKDQIALYEGIPIQRIRFKQIKNLNETFNSRKINANLDEFHTRIYSAT